MPPRSRTLADSNQRGREGVYSHLRVRAQLRRAGWRFKLDWIFVKPFINDSRRGEKSDRFAPHFPIVMRELNDAVEGRISDHPPMTVDLPFAEPTAVKP